MIYEFTAAAIEDGELECVTHGALDLPDLQDPDHDFARVSVVIAVAFESKHGRPPTGINVACTGLEPA